MRKPTLDRVVRLWIERNISSTGEFGASLFHQLMSGLPAETPKAWVNDGVEAQRFLNTQESRPADAGDSWEPTERERFDAWCDVLESLDSVDAIADAWIARSKGSSEKCRQYWWHCAVITLAWGENVSTKIALTRLKEAVEARVKPQPPEPDPDTTTPKRRTRKQSANTPANGQGQEVAQQVGTTGRVEHVPVATVDGWKARLLTKQTPYACAASWAKWRHLYQHCAAQCRGLTLARMEALGATEEVVLNGKIHLVPLPAQLDGIIAKYEEEKAARCQAHATVKRAA